VTSSRPVDCLILGTAVADILVRPVPLTRAVGAGRLFHVDPIEVTTGGIVCNTGIAMRRLGMNVAAASLVGADLWGGMIRGRLCDEGIDVAAVESRDGLATSTTGVFIDAGGERSFAHHVGGCAAIDVSFVERCRAACRRARMVVIGYQGLLPALEADLAAAVRIVREAGSQVAVETAGSGGSLDDLAPALPEIDCYVPSLDEARQQTGLDDPREIIHRYRSLGCVGLLGVKLGTAGTLLSPTAGCLLELPCIPAPAPVADTTGAGDSLLAGLLTGLLRGMPVREAGLLGAATAACCVTGVGATAGLRSFDETLALTLG
jgi:sugar/nucleoside kinase (ribokinase family)